MNKKQIAGIVGVIVAIAAALGYYQPGPDCSCPPMTVEADAGAR